MIAELIKHLLFLTAECFFYEIKLACQYIAAKGGLHALQNSFKVLSISLMWLWACWFLWDTTKDIQKDRIQLLSQIGVIFMSVASKLVFIFGLAMLLLIYNKALNL